MPFFNHLSFCGVVLVGITFWVYTLHFVELLSEFQFYVFIVWKVSQVSGFHVRPTISTVATRVHDCIAIKAVMKNQKLARWVF